MSFDEKNPRPGEGAHRVILDARSRLTVSGVDGVESFDENSIVMSTSEGSLIIRGRTFTLKNSAWTAGTCWWRAQWTPLTYEETDPRQGSFLGRLFRG